LASKITYQSVFATRQDTGSIQDHAHNFYTASLRLIKGIARGDIKSESEGLAAVFLFRHYLELALKDLLEAGRALTDEGLNSDSVQTTERTHVLTKLWQLVVVDAKPKFCQWEEFDTEFVEHCIAEFDAVDQKGFAFRYRGHSVEKLEVDFGQLERTVEHVNSTLESIRVNLMLTWVGNEYGSEEIE